ncbi:MAG TPA: hypothetical protein VH418_05900 [Solirubrobacteraceae bacterium]
MQAGDPNLPLDPADEQLAERGRALIAAAVAETRAPLALRERIEADRERVGSGPRRRRLRGLLVPAGGLVAAAVVAVVLLVGGGGAPSVLATASLAARGPVLPAPEENGTLLKSSVDGVPFPYWGSLKWESVGARNDKIDGRDAKTVYYANPAGAQAAYTILGGDAIDPPSGATKRTQKGVDLFVVQKDGRRVVTWQRDGHTCVLSAPASVPEQKLLALAAWDGGGGVPF